MRRSAALLVSVVTLGVALRLYVYDHLDLRGWPGPTAPQTLISGLTADGHYGWSGWLVSAALPWTDGDVLAAGTLIKLVATVAGCVGAALAGHAVAGRLGAWGAGLVGACWGPPLYTTVIGGADGPAWGLVWLGLGLAWWGATRRAWALPLVALGAYVATFGVGVKFSGAPALGYLGLVPVLALRRGPLHGVLAGGFGALGAAVGRGFLDTGPGGGPSPDLSTLRPDHVVEGLQRLWVMGPQEGMNEGLFIELFVLATLGALLPGRAWIARLGLLAAAAVAIGLPASSWDPHYVMIYRPRWAAPAGLALVVLAACACVLPLRRLGRLGPLRYLPVVPLAVWAAADGLAFLQAWDRFRVDQEGAEPWSGWTAWPSLERRYRHQKLQEWWSASTRGGIDLYEIGRDAPPGGLLLPVLHDARESHALLGAASVGVWPAVGAQDQQCCASRESQAACAERVVAALDARGAALVVPGNPTERAYPGQAPFSSALYRAAASRGEFTKVGTSWHVWLGAGDGDAEMPCLMPEEREPKALERWRQAF